MFMHKQKGTPNNKKWLLLDYYNRVKHITYSYNHTIKHRLLQVAKNSSIFVD